LITKPGLGSANFRLKTQNAGYFAKTWQSLAPQVSRQPTGLANKSILVFHLFYCFFCFLSIVLTKIFKKIAHNVPAVTDVWSAL
jgi:glucose-6-phosphate-specific signal transduction histidine kinase